MLRQVGLRLHRTHADIESLPAWLTTVTIRLCLDRLRAQTTIPYAEIFPVENAPDPAAVVVLADTVGAALQVVLDRLSPGERVAFVLHDSFGFEFSTIATVLDNTPQAPRKLASRARAKVGQPAPEDQLGDWEVVDAFMSAAKGDDYLRLIQLLAPDVYLWADAEAVLAGTPERTDGPSEVATFFNGSAHSGLAVFLGERPAAAWFNRGQALVVFDFTIVAGRVGRITFRAEPAALSQAIR